MQGNTVDTFRFGCKDLIDLVKRTLLTVIRRYHDLMIHNLNDTTLVQFIAMILNGHLNACGADGARYLAQNVLHSQHITNEQLECINEEVVRPIHRALVARTATWTDWISRPPGRYYDVKVEPGDLELKVEWAGI